MPIFGRYLLKNYLKVLVLAVLSFIAILLVSRLEEIAQFATLGAGWHYVALFTLYQIPYILPIAIPISCLISSIILFQRLSHTHELIALRAGGISIGRIAAPILVMAAFISIGTFYIVSEVATSCHMQTRRMVHDLTAVNPLLLLQSSKIAKLRGSYVQMDQIRSGEAAQDLVIAVKSAPEESLSLILARDVAMENGVLVAGGVSCLTTPQTEEKVSTLVIENQETLSSSAPEFSLLLRRKGWKISTDHLKLALLRLDIQWLKYMIWCDAQNGSPFNTSVYNKLLKCRVEIVRRVAMGLTAFTFTLMGIAFGMEISRNQSKRGVLIVATLGALTLIAFFVAKELDHLFWIASSLFLLPQVIIISASLWTLKRVQRGVE